MGQLGRRQAVLFSLIVHLMIVTALANRTRMEGPIKKPQVSPTPRPRMVFVPPRPAVRPVPVPAPVAPPPPTRLAEPPKPNAKDRISIGGPSAERAKHLVLERDKDITKQAPAPAVPQPVPSAAPGPIGPGTGIPDPAQNAQLRQPAPARPGLGTGDPRPLSQSVRRIEERLGNLGGGGMAGPGREMGGLFFDPQGADFTAWINHFKNEVYRNWIPPQAVLFGFKGHCDFEFTVERDGRVSAVKLMKSTGTPALDRAAQNALLGSRLMALPSDYAPPRLTIQVTFFYNENPKG